MYVVLHSIFLIVSEGNVNIVIPPLSKFSVAKYDKNIKEVATEKIQKEFLTMEEQEVCTRTCTLLFSGRPKVCAPPYSGHILPSIVLCKVCLD